jgi:hypothetical protein
MEQETAVDYIFKKLDVLFNLTPQITVTGNKEEWENLFKKAKAMEKTQIIEAVMYGDIRGKLETYMTAEEYYNEKYNQ